MEKITTGEQFQQYNDKYILAEDEVVTIMPCTSNNINTINVARKALESHKKTCGVTILVMDNNSPEIQNRRILQKITEDLGYVYKYFDIEFSLNGFWNLGAFCTKSKYIIHSSCDVLFHDDWLDEILYIQDKYPDKYNSLHPYSYPKLGDAPMEECAYMRYTKEPKEVSDQVTEICTYLNFFKRSRVYYWDEAFPLWCSDNDYRAYLYVNNLTAGICKGSRVDTVLSGIYKFLEPLPHHETYTKWAISRYYRKWINKIKFTDHDMSEFLGL
jgi:hypothetical protein